MSEVHYDDCVFASTKKCEFFLLQFLIFSIFVVLHNFVRERKWGEGVATIHGNIPMCLILFFPSVSPFSFYPLHCSLLLFDLGLKMSFPREEAKMGNGTKVRLKSWLFQWLFSCSKEGKNESWRASIERIRHFISFERKWNHTFKSRQQLKVASLDLTLTNPLDYFWNCFTDQATNPFRFSIFLKLFMLVESFPSDPSELLSSQNIFGCLILSGYNTMKEKEVNFPFKSKWTERLLLLIV